MKQFSLRYPARRTLSLYLLTMLAMLISFYLGSLVFIGLTLYYIYQNRKQVLTYIRQDWVIFLFMIYTLAVAAYNQNMVGCLLPLVYLLMYFYFKIYYQKIDSNTYFTILKIVSLSAIPLTLICVYIYLSYALEHGYGVFYVFKYNALQTRAEATFFNANYYGLFCAFSWAASLYLMKKEKNMTWYCLGGFALLANAISVVLTASRMLPPTIILTSLWMLVWMDRRWLKYILACIVLGLALVMVKPSLIPRIDSIAYAFQDRFNLWAVGLQIFMSHPLIGRGSMAFMNFYYLYSDYAQMHAHSLYINSLADFGLIGTGMILWMLKPLFGNIKTLYRDKDLRLEFALISGLIVAVLVHGIMDVAIFWIQTAFVFLSLIMISSEKLKKI